MDDQSRRGRGLAAALVCLVTVVAFETMSVATIMPEVRADIGGLSLYGWAFSGLALGEVIGIVVAGSWADRANPVRPILAGLGVYVVGLLVAGLAPSMAVVVVGRVLQGYGSGTVPAVAYVCVGRGYAEAERARVFAWMSTAWVVPSMIGPRVAGDLAETVGWRWVFVGLIPVVVGVGALAVAPISRLGAPAVDAVDAAADRARGRRTIGLAAVAVVGTAVALGAFQIEVVALLVGVAAVGLTVLRWAFVRVAPAGTLRLARGVPATVAVRGLLTFSFLGADAYVALALHDVRGMDLRHAGTVLSASAITWTAGSWFSAKRIAVVGPRRLVGAGFTLVVSGIGLMAAVVNSSVNPWWGLGAWLVAGGGIGLAYAPLTQAVISAAEPSQLGAATSALQLSDVLGFALGSGLGGALVAVADRSDIRVDGSTIEAGVLMVFALTAAMGLLGLFGSGRMHRYLGGGVRRDLAADEGDGTDAAGPAVAQA